MRRAFTLVEIAIVLFIVAIIIGFGLTSFSSMTLGEKYRLTRAYLAKMETAMAQFAATNGHLACPDIDCDGEEDRCNEDDGCDLDDDGEVDIEKGVCYATFYNTHKSSYKPPQCMVEKKENFPPYLFPYKTLGLKRDDAFAKPFRYDVQDDLAATSNIKHFCEVLEFLRSKSRTMTKDSLASRHYLPIVTTSQDSKDDERITPPYGYSVAAIFISQGECAGVSGKNRGGNREYASQTTNIEATSECNDPNKYDDITQELTFDTLASIACKGITYPKKLTITAPQAAALSVQMRQSDDSWECANLSGIGFANASGLSITFDSKAPEYVRFFTSSDCSDDEALTIFDMVMGDTNSDGAVGWDDEGVYDGLIYLDVYAQDGLWLRRWNGSSFICQKALSPIELYPIALDAMQYKTGWYANGADCFSDANRIISTGTLKDRNDTNGDNIVYVTSSASGDNHFSTFTIALYPGTSYYHEGRCYDVTLDRGKVVQLPLRTFAIFFDRPACDMSDSSHIYPLFAIINSDILHDNNGRCIITPMGVQCGE